jgi:hypothetical protein
MPDAADYSVEPLHQWAGGQVVMTAAGGMFEAGDVILTGADTLAVFEQSADHVRLPLPSHVNGPTALEVWRGLERLGEVRLEIYGFEEINEYPARMDDLISEVPVPSGVSVAARRFDRRTCDPLEGGDFVWIYLSTGIHRTFRSGECHQGMFKVGVDPLQPEVFYEYRSGTPDECHDGSCTVVHGGRIVGGELVDLGWLERPCNRWSCEPLAGDIWIVPDWAQTCRVVRTPTGETCETISRGFGDDPQGIERLWSRDVALSLGPDIAFRLSTGEELYRTGVWSHSGAPDEARGLFYLASRGQVVAMRGEDGQVTHSDSIEGVPFVAYDRVRDLLFVYRRVLEVWDPLTYELHGIEVRDPVTFELHSTIALPEDLVGQYPRLLIDNYMERAYVVLSGARRYDEALERYREALGTPVISVRLVPP